MKESLHDEIEGLETTLFATIQQYASVILGLPIVYDDHTYPYFFNDSNADGITDEGEVSYGNRYTDFDAELLKASYNYQTSKKEPSGYIHNSKYMAQLLAYSTEALLGTGTDANVLITKGRGTGKE